MKHFRVLVLLMFIFFKIESQNKIKYDSLNNSKYLNLSLNFCYTNTGKISTGSKGVNFGIGFNLGRLFSKTLIFTPSVDIKVFSGFFQHDFKKEFVSDFNNNVSLNNQDSLGAQTLYKSLNNNNSYSHYGNVLFTYGINFSPFPKKFAGLGISVKKGIISYRFTNANFLGNNAPDNAFISVPINYNIEITAKPFLELGKINFFKSNLFFKYLISNIRIGVFFQELTWGKAKFENISFNSILTNGFMQKYKSDRQIGLSIKFVYE